MPALALGASTRPDANSTLAAAIRARRASHRAIVLVGDDIDHPAHSAGEGESRPDLEELLRGTEPPEPSLELIDDREATRGVSPRRAERLPTPAVVDEQIDADALGRHRPEHASGETDRPFGAGALWGHAKATPAVHRLIILAVAVYAASAENAWYATSIVREGPPGAVARNVPVALV